MDCSATSYVVNINNTNLTQPKIIHNRKYFNRKYFSKKKYIREPYQYLQRCHDQYKGLNQKLNLNKKAKCLKATSCKLGCGNRNTYLKVLTTKKIEE